LAWSEWARLLRNETKRARPCRSALWLGSEAARPLVVHPAHAAHSSHATAAAAHGGRLRLGEIGDGALGGEQQGRDGGRVLQGGAGDLGRVDDAGLDHVDPLHLGGVETDVLLLVLGAVGDDGAVDSRVLGDLADRLLEGALRDLETDLLVVEHLGPVGLFEGERCLDEGSFGAQMIASKPSGTMPLIEGSTANELWMLESQCCDCRSRD